MTRRAAAGLGRLLPLLLIAAAVVVLAGAALLAACGGSSGGSSTAQPTATVTVTAPGSATASPPASPSPSASPAQTPVRLYFLRDEKLGVAERLVAHTTMPATASMKALLAGPTSGESAAGLTSAIPKGTRLLSLTIANASARVDLSRSFTSISDGQSITARVAEIVYTLTRFSTVRSVELLVEGNPVELGGTAVSGPQTRADWRDYEPAIFVEAPGVGAGLKSPFVLTGTASVFEGTFQARLVDSSGRRIVNVTVQASRGAPGRGRFSKEVAFSTSAKSGTLIVFDQSMEDGSRQDEVKIPVTFAVH